LIAWAIFHFADSKWFRCNVCGLAIVAPVALVSAAPPAGAARAQ